MNATVKISRLQVRGLLADFLRQEGASMVFEVLTEAAEQAAQRELEQPVAQRLSRLATKLETLRQEEVEQDLKDFLSETCSRPTPCMTIVPRAVEDDETRIYQRKPISSLKMTIVDECMQVRDDELFDDELTDPVFDLKAVMGQ